MSNGLKYTWVPFLVELSQKILNFRNDRSKLIEKLKKIELLKYVIITGSETNNSFPFNDIDPFTILFLSAAQKKDTKKLDIIFRSLKKEFDISAEIPLDWNGIPSAPPSFRKLLRNSYIYTEKGHDDIEILWELFEKSLTNKKYDDHTEEIFRKSFYLKGVKTLIATGMFLLNPNNFVPLDYKILNFLKSKDNVFFDISYKVERSKQSEKNIWFNYFDFCELVKKEIFNWNIESIVDLSYKAYLAGNLKEVKIEPKKQNLEYKKVNLIKDETNNIKKEFIIQQNEKDKNLNIIFYGVPGTGKTLAAFELANKITNNKKENITFITFHQSYEYEDFIEGLKVETTNENNIIYKIKDGIFKDLCKKASEKENEKFVIIIDEINRGNISKIFGELITLIESTKRKGEKFELEIELPYSREKLSVPSNLYLIGTMNTSDRSITYIDSALRRRFRFIEKIPNYNLFKNKTINKDYKNIDIGQLLKVINERIEIKYDRDHIIGHSYFLKCINIKNENNLNENEKYENLIEIFKYDIIPMLQEYFFDDYNTIRFILNDNDTLSEYNFLKKKNYFEKDSKKYSEKELYEIDEKAFNYPESFIKIYENKKDNNDNDLTENKENESN